MDNIYGSKWITTPEKAEKRCFEFVREFTAEDVEHAYLSVSALGIYTAVLNGKRIGDFIFAPGWTSYEKRLQYQKYDISEFLTENGRNTLSVTVSAGWRMHENKKFSPLGLDFGEYALIACIELVSADGTTRVIPTDSEWLAGETPYRYSDMYNGEVYDAGFVPGARVPSMVISDDTHTLIPQEGEPVKEQERLGARGLIMTPAGETVIDFGQNITGYVEFKICGAPGEKALIHHAEVLGPDDNFYTENLRKAKAEITFICDGKPHTYKPGFSFQGFRYIRLTSWPGKVRLSDFTAIEVHSELSRIGYFDCSDRDINQLYHNIIWGQKDNFLDVPTDCPQRDERLGWTGDAQVFARCASLNFDTRRFFHKWLADLAADQHTDGAVTNFVPDAFYWSSGGSPAWADAAVIVPWQLYLIYGDRDILKRQLPSMKRWIDYTYECEEKYFDPKRIFGDWLSTDVEGDNCNGSTDKVYISYAFRVYSTELFIKIARVVAEESDGIDIPAYEKRLEYAKSSVREKYFPDGKLSIRTQTANVLALKFGLCPEKNAEMAATLAGMIHENGDRLTTGFVGTPYLLHVLSEHGYTELAYTLLFQRRCPSWLYSVDRGATTMWEHWDGIKEDGSLWSATMNSFNHYAYGAVGDWLYGVVAGIDTDEREPGFTHIVFKPVTDKRLSFVRASFDADNGVISSSWERKKNGVTVYRFSVPEGSHATAYLGNDVYELPAGTHVFRI